MKLIKLFKNVFQRHTKPKDHNMERFEKCKGCEHGVLIKRWLIHCIGGNNCMVTACKDSSRRCNYKPKRIRKGMGG